MFRKPTRPRGNVRKRSSFLDEEESEQPTRQNITTSNQVQGLQLNAPLLKTELLEEQELELIARELRDLNPINENKEEIVLETVDLDKFLVKKTEAKNDEVKEMAKGEKTKTVINNTKSVVNLSFNEEMTEASEFKIKKSKNSKRLVELAATGSLTSIERQGNGNSYNADQLALLKRERDRVNGLIENFEQVEITNVNSHSGGIIPDSDAILLAKKKRENRRLGIFDSEESKNGTSQDFISFDQNSKKEEYGSRLVREEDEIGDGEDELADHMGDRFKLKKGDMKSQLAAEARKDMTQAFKDFAANEDYDDDEFRKLEMAQLRRTVVEPKLKGLLSQTKSHKVSTPVNNYPPLPTFSAVKQTLSFEIAQFKARLQPYQNTLLERSSQLESIDIKLQENNDRIDILEARVAKYQKLTK